MRVAMRLPHDFVDHAWCDNVVTIALQWALSHPRPIPPSITLVAASVATVTTRPYPVHILIVHIPSYICPNPEQKAAASSATRSSVPVASQHINGRVRRPCKTVWKTRSWRGSYERPRRKVGVSHLTNYRSPSRRCLDPQTIWVRRADAKRFGIAATYVIPCIISCTHLLTSRILAIFNYDPGQYEDSVAQPDDDNFDARTPDTNQESCIY